MSSSQKKECILIVDDAATTLEVLQRILKAAGYQVFTAPSVARALEILENTALELVITDLKMPKVSGLDLVRHVRENFKDTEVMMITGYPSIEGAVNAIKIGAEDFLAKPFTDEELLATVGRALDKLKARRSGHATGEQATAVHKGFIGNSKVMQRIFTAITKAASTSATVLITGESGTGKELVAKAIHYNSDRKDAPFIPVNCAAIPEQLLESELFGHMRGSFTDAKADKRGLFEEAQKGTLFLDEISELPLMLQAKILRAIQEKEIRRVGANKPIAVDVRIIAATNLNLTEEVKAKRFREDLYYRLNVIELRLPPLRERREDISLLVDAFMRKCAESRGKQIQGVSESALAMLVDYTWPGNVRELENVIERAVTLTRSEKIVPADLPSSIQGARGDRRLLDEAAERTLSLDDVEKEYILKILEKTGGNKYQAAQMLGIDRKTLYRKLGEIEGKTGG